MILVAYFSHSGNTREVANQIQKNTGGDIFEIQSEVPYSDDYDIVVEQAKKEIESNHNPALKSKVKNIEENQVVDPDKKKKKRKRTEEEKKEHKRKLKLHKKKLLKMKEQSTKVE